MTLRTHVSASILALLFGAGAALTALPAHAQDADEAARAALPAGVLNVDDPVVLAFGRMLSHPPVTVAPKVPAGFGEDPLIAAMAWPFHYRAAQKTPALPLRAEVR